MWLGPVRVTLASATRSLALLGGLTGGILAWAGESTVALDSVPAAPVVQPSGRAADEALDKIRIDHTTKAQIRALFGEPWRTHSFADDPDDKDYEIWEYRRSGDGGPYKLHLEFDELGIVRVIAKIPENVGPQGVPAQISSMRAMENVSLLGEPGDAANVSRTIRIAMGDDMRFSPANIAVERGETIRFVVTNAGTVKHEMVLGPLKELREHAELMKKFPAMEHVAPNEVSVPPGGTGEIVWKFTRSGRFDFACLQPGHFDAGMRGTVSVQPSPAQAADDAKVTLAQSSGAETAAPATPSRTASPPMFRGQPMSSGEVREVDRAQGKVTIAHGPIANLNMPGMTMVFRVTDPRLLDHVQPGERVWFRAEMAGDDLTIVDLSARQ